MLSSLHVVGKVFQNFLVNGSFDDSPHQAMYYRLLERRSSRERAMFCQNQATER